jgi:hypothetical protein
MRRLIMVATVALVMAAMMVAMAMPALAQAPGFRIECEVGGGVLSFTASDPHEFPNGFGLVNQLPLLVGPDRIPPQDCERGPVF